MNNFLFPSSEDGLNRIDRPMHEGIRYFKANNAGASVKEITDYFAQSYKMVGGILCEPKSKRKKDGVQPSV